MTLMKADFASWPNELISVPCSHCAKQIDIEPLTIKSLKEFYELEENLRIDATTQCRCTKEEK